LSGVQAVAASTLWSLALAADGSVWAWGDNRGGQLGNGTVSGAPNPVPRQIRGLGGVAAVAAGGHHGLALTADGRVWTWGRNDRGQLGSGGVSAPRPTPAPVAGLTGVVAVAGGVMHSLAVRRDGSVWAWGANQQGQLGNGATGDASAPVQVGDLGDVIAVAGGGEHSLAVRRDGTVWAWGANHQGQLGNGRATDVPTPQAVPGPVDGLTGATGVAAGIVHSLALQSDGSVWTWGSNGAGQLGIGAETAYRATPAPLGSPRDARAVAAGDAHSVVLVEEGS
jgi:alpha-tubulin suppressor-like RCC1 family protein